MLLTAPTQYCFAKRGKIRKGVIKVQEAHTINCRIVTDFLKNKLLIWMAVAAAVRCQISTVGYFHGSWMID